MLELVHFDICRPINPISNGGKRYFITFIDNYIQKTWVYFLQEKAEAFKSFKMLVEKEASKYIKFFRNDCGGEYTSQEFVIFCENHGIQKKITPAYSSQQNEVLERKNRTILNMVQTILLKGHIPRSFWLEVVI